MSKLSHFNRHGEARMVDIAAKAVTHRIAIAEGTIVMNRETLTMVQKGLHKKGDVLGIARIAGIMAAIFPGAVVRPLDIPRDADYQAFNPSVCMHRGRLHCVVRTANYRIVGGRYVIADPRA